MNMSTRDRYQTPEPEINLNDPPSSSPLAPSDAVLQASIEKVETWRGAMDSLRAHMNQAADLLDKLQPLRNEKESSTDRGDLLEKLNELKDVQEKLDTMVVQAKTLAKTTWEDLELLGVVQEPCIVPIHELEAGLVKELGMEAQVYAQAADEASEQLLEDLASWSEALNTHTEAASRIFVDCCIHRIIPLAQGFRFGHAGKGRIFICPELVIARSRGNLTVHDKTTKSLLAMAGRSDYAVAYVPGWPSIGIPAQAGIEAYLKDLSVVRATQTSLPIMKNRLQNLCLSVIEAKRLGRQDDALLEALPQAIAEALVLGQRFRGPSETVRTTPFILTNGTQWLFGVLEPSSDAGAQWRWTCFRSEPYEIQPASPASGGREGVRCLLDALVYWNCAQRNRILDVMRQLL